MKRRRTSQKGSANALGTPAACGGLHERADVNDEQAATGELPAICRQLPWETAEEHAKFHYFLLCPHPRSVRKAYRLYCEANGIVPRRDPPSCWYQLYRGQYRAFRRAERQMAAIERAGARYGRVPDWPLLQAVAIDLNGDPLPGVPTWAERRAAYWAAVERGEVEPPPAPGLAEGR